MNKSFLFLFVILLTLTLIPIISAKTQINIYLSENGDAKFYGKTSENIILPEGISIKDGNILGTTKILSLKS